MGLGKTIQTIALLAHLACEKGDWGPHLIVVPTSVMLNWEMEFKKWCPAFKILTYYGNPKERKMKRVVSVNHFSRINPKQESLVVSPLSFECLFSFRKSHCSYSNPILGISILSLHMLARQSLYDDSLYSLIIINFS